MFLSDKDPDKKHARYKGYYIIILGANIIECVDKPILRK